MGVYTEVLPLHNNAMFGTGAYTEDGQPTVFRPVWFRSFLPGSPQCRIQSLAAALYSPCLTGSERVTTAIHIEHYRAEHSGQHLATSIRRDRAEGT